MFNHWVGKGRCCSFPGNMGGSTNPVAQLTMPSLRLVQTIMPIYLHHVSSVTPAYLRHACYYRHNRIPGLYDINMQCLPCSQNVGVYQDVKRRAAISIRATREAGHHVRKLVSLYNISS